MGNSSKRRYESKHKVTRIHLADYLVLKGLSQRAGVSMAEALHKIITRDWAMAQSAVEAMPVPVTRARSMPVTIGFARKVETNGHR